MSEDQHISSRTRCRVAGNQSSPEENVDEVSSDAPSSNRTPPQDELVPDLELDGGNQAAPLIELINEVGEKYSTECRPSIKQRSSSEEWNHFSGHETRWIPALQ